MHYITPCIALKRFRIVTHSYAALFSAFYISKSNENYTKALTVSERTLKIKVMSRFTIFKILLTSSVFGKQRVLEENDIALCFQN